MSSILKQKTQQEGRKAFWVRHDRAGGQAARRRLAQLTKRGVGICVACDSEVSRDQMQIDDAWKGICAACVAAVALASL